MNLECTEIDSPVGMLGIATIDGNVVALCFEGLWSRRRHALEKKLATRAVPAPDPAGIVSKLRAYFQGDLAAIEDVRVRADGTPFQQSVWSALRRIPAGQTRSYGEIAVAIGRPTAVRAVGAANGANPVGIVVPCHRVIGSNGTLTGFGGGLPTKQWLLAHEGALSGQLGLSAPLKKSGTGTHFADPRNAYLSPYFVTATRR